jgi:hypothetical protein
MVVKEPPGQVAGYVRRCAQFRSGGEYPVRGCMRSAHFETHAECGRETCVAT